MQRERRYRSKLLYLVRTSLEACVDPQAECMQVVWGPWKLRTRRGMGITGMGGLLEPSTARRSYRRSPVSGELFPRRQRASFGCGRKEPGCETWRTLPIEVFFF